MPALFPLDNLTGAAFVGFVLSVVVYGITCLQAYLYFTEHSSRDRTFLKVFVATLMLMDTLHVALITHALYWYMVTNFGDYSALQEVVWSMDFQTMVVDMVAFSVQMFFAWRVYILSDKKNLWAPLIIFLGGVGLLVSGVGFTIIAWKGSYTKSTDNIPWTVAGLICALISDITITGSMMFYLSRTRSGFDSTQKLISKLILYSLNTFLLTTIFNVLTLVFFVKFTSSLLYAPFFFVLVRVYSCAFLSTLNTRKMLRTHEGGATGSTVQGTISLSNMESSGRTSDRAHEPITFYAPYAREKRPSLDV